MRLSTYDACHKLHACSRFSCFSYSAVQSIAGFLYVFKKESFEKIAAHGSLGLVPSYDHDRS
jgi:hypothetical protein